MTCQGGPVVTASDILLEQFSERRNISHLQELLKKYHFSLSHLFSEKTKRKVEKNTVFYDIYRDGCFGIFQYLFKKHIV